VKAEFDRLEDNNLLFSSEVFKLAIQIRSSMVTATSKTCFDKLTALKSLLPKVIRVIISGTKSVIVNEAYTKEYLYSSNKFMSQKRLLFSWVPGEHLEAQAPFTFSSSDDGSTFFIRSLWSNDYVYASSSLFDAKRRSVLSSDKTNDPKFKWNVEILSDNKIRIKSTLYNEYLYAESKTFKYDSDRRSVFTGLPGHACHINCNWIVKTAGGNDLDMFCD
jgi:hypothetical protein